jgi:hypothetical protein
MAQIFNEKYYEKFVGNKDISNEKKELCFFQYFMLDFRMSYIECFCYLH